MTSATTVARALCRVSTSRASCWTANPTARVTTVSIAENVIGMPPVRARISPGSTT
jgi:hypothetical protein